MTIVSSPEQLTDRYLGHPRLDKAPRGILPEIRINPEQTNPGMVPVNKGPVYNCQFSTAGWTPVILGQVVEPPEWSEYYLVEWLQGGRHPFTLVKEFEPFPAI